MKPSNFKVFSTRNIYSHRKCIRLTLEPEESDEDYSEASDYFNNRLLMLVPELASHQCALQERLGFVKSICSGTTLNHICGHIALALQKMLGIDVSFCTESQTDSYSCYTVYEFDYENTAKEAGIIAVDIINALINKEDFDLKERFNRLEEILLVEKHAMKTLNVVEKHYEERTNNKYPLVAVTGTNGKTTTTRLIGYILAKAGYNVGMTTTGGIYINGKCILEGDTTGPASALSVLMDETVDAAVLETARGGIIRDGLAYDLADVAVITNITDDHLGLDEVNTIEELAKVKALIGEAVKPDGYVVINGDDPVSLSVLDRFKSKIIIFSKEKYNKAMRYNIKNGGYGVYADQDYLYIQKDETSASPLMKMSDIGITFGGALTYNIENALAVCSAAVGLGIDYFIIRDSLMEFKCNAELNPGRFNTYDINGITAILDYGHNIDGYKSVLQGLKSMKFNRLIGVIGVPGDRLDRNVLDVGNISGNYFDHIFIKEDKDKRGRAKGEIASLLKQGVLSSGFDSSKTDIILSEEAAFSSALDSAKPGDAVIVFFEDYKPLLEIIKNRINNSSSSESPILQLSI